MNNLHFVSYYTNNGIYPDLIRDLQKSLEKHSLKFYLKQETNRGSWVKNCALKAEFLLEQLQNNKPNDCVVWNS